MLITEKQAATGFGFDSFFTVEIINIINYQYGK